MTDGAFPTHTLDQLATMIRSAGFVTISGRVDFSTRHIHYELRSTQEDATMGSLPLELDGYTVSYDVSQSGRQQ